MSHLAQLIEKLADSPAVRDKIEIRRAYAPAQSVGREGTPLGDDCAAIRESDGSYLLLAAEGLIDSFVEDDPWFAGYSAVMVNISDICAMGGRPTAIVDVVWTPSHERTEKLWDGMRRAAADYGVPIVGGHTTLSANTDSVHLAAAIVGRATRLMTSFDSKSGDALLMAVDLNGSYRGDKPFWNATLETEPAKLRNNIELLPRIAENGWCRAAKDISNGGIVGTLVMLLECSNVGADVVLDDLPIPPDVDLYRWLLSFPSFGYLLSVPDDSCGQVIELFAASDICCKEIGRITANPRFAMTLGSEREEFWRSSSEVISNACA